MRHCAYTPFRPKAELLEKIHCLELPHPLRHRWSGGLDRRDYRLQIPGLFRGGLPHRSSDGVCFLARLPDLGSASADLYGA